MTILPGKIFATRGSLLWRSDNTRYHGSAAILAGRVNKPAARTGSPLYSCLFGTSGHDFATMLARNACYKVFTASSVKISHTVIHKMFSDIVNTTWTSTFNICSKKSDGNCGIVTH